MDKSIFYAVFPACIIIFMIQCYCVERQSIAFGKKIKSFSTQSDINMLKDFVKDQMIRSVVALPFGGGSFLIYISYLVAGSVGFLENMSICIPFIIMGFWSIRVRKFEKLVATIPAVSNELEEQRDMLIKIWHTKLFPIFDK